MIIFEENAPDMQDKPTLSRGFSFSTEADKGIQARKTRSGSQTRKGETVRAYLLHAEIEEIDRIRKKTKDRTRLAEMSDLVRIGLSVKLGKKHADVILPPILDAIRQEQKAFSNRWTHIFSELYFVLDFMRRLLVAFVSSINPKLAQNIEKEMEKARTSL